MLSKRLVNLQYKHYRGRKSGKMKKQSDRNAKRTSSFFSTCIFSHFPHCLRFSTTCAFPFFLLYTLICWLASSLSRKAQHTYMYTNSVCMFLLYFVCIYILRLCCVCSGYRFLKSFFGVHILICKSLTSPSTYFSHTRHISSWM